MTNPVAPHPHAVGPAQPPQQDHYPPTERAPELADGYGPGPPLAAQPGGYQAVGPPALPGTPAPQGVQPDVSATAITSSFTPVHPSLRQAPAAVQAAAEQVLAAHAAHSNIQEVQPEPSQPYVPAPKPAPAHPQKEPQSSSTVKPGMVVAGRYYVEKLIGRGGMGTVYSVRHVNTDERLALKMLHPALAENESAVERFRTEARAPVRIGSEHVVRIVDADICKAANNAPFMVMEMLRGHDLRGELKRRGALPAGEVVLYLKQVSRALDKAHAKSIIHRDLKPGNIY
ncbi:MAG: serine/threonine protein kinase, partial [Deltaproteobacteria bacterium]|nr:serine/threonine protein kinase [Deltaproteobacteria bacterium]